MGDSKQPSVLGWLVSHVFLPPQLPQQAQSDVDERNTSLELLRLLIESVDKYRENVPLAEKGQWQIVERMLTRMREFVEAPMTAEGLLGVLQDMTLGDVLPLHIRAQNAVVVVRKEAEGSIFAVHEASPTNEAVYATTGKLLITFPGPAVHLPTAVATNTSFLTNLSLFLSHMDVDALDALGQTKKAESIVTETRNTADPRYITQLLLGILHGCEGASNADIRRHRKRVAEEVMYHSALNPWRRLPLWLIIRSTLQTTLSTNNDYKAYMILFLSRFVLSCVKHENHFDSDLLYVMRSKIAYRLAKLSDSCPDFVLRSVEECVQTVQDVLQRRWKAVEDHRKRQAPWKAPPRVSLEADTTLSLDNSRRLLLDALQRNDVEHKATVFSASHKPRFLGERDFLQFGQGRLSEAVAKETPLVALADFEACVRISLFPWVDGVALDAIEEACMCLHSCFEQYQEVTKKHYLESNPHDQSVAVLTLLAIWTATDRLAVMAHPLLARYSPEIPVHFLEPLVLQDAHNVQLAMDIERYIRQRHRVAPPNAISVFEAEPQPSSFAIQMFAQDTSYAHKRTQIENDARNARTRKIGDLRSLNARHDSLLRQVRSLEHTNATRYIPSYGSWVEKQYHSPTCRRCALANEANSLKIGVHEWPLPSDDLKAKAVVFELICPPPYSLWREMTFTVLTSVGHVIPDASVSTKEPEILLRDYNPLSFYATARSSSITLGSTTKPFIRSHYRELYAPTEESSVCVNNGLRFHLFDSLGKTWITSQPLSTSSIAYLCAPRLPPDSIYAHLQYAIEGTTHTSNEILTDQAACPQALSIHEHLSFASMRSGGRLQWLNLARELRARTLSLSSGEVHHLIAQIIWQLGPLCEEQREWHIELLDATFCSRVLQESRLILEGIGVNWRERMSVYTLVLISLRILESCPEPTVQTQAREVLVNARRIMSVIRDSLLQRLSKVKESALHAAQRSVCEAAAICISTYDVPTEHLAAVLHSADGNGSYELLRSMVLAGENAPIDIAQAPLHTQYLLRRHERVLHRLETVLRADIIADSSGLHRAVASLWPTYRVDGSPWSVSPAPNERQVHHSFHAQGVPQLVHLDLLTGTLLVNGQPLGRLPTTITRDSTFRRIFGKAILEVVPAADPGMQYETRSAISGWTISFAHTTKRLIVRARRADATGNSVSSTLQLVAHTVFQDDLPHFLINEHVQWMNLATGTIEFRPLHNPWLEDPSNWFLLSLREGRPMLQRGQSSVRLVDLRSPTFRAVRACLGVLELMPFTVATYDGERLRAELPRLRLSFYMNDAGELESLNFRDMIVDSNQAAHGTFFGLVAQLVLKHKHVDAQTLPRSRRILIPDGKVLYEKTATHVSVNIALPKDVERILYHEFAVDSDLGRLTDVSSMASRLFQCLLHAVTSGCLCDPLTGLTGTEQALKELSGARMLSFRGLASRELELLREISSLTPERTFYPEHLRVMQQVVWKNLPAHSQHTGFKLAVDAIVDYGRDLDMFVPQTSSELAADWSQASAERDPTLHERAVRRSGSHYPLDILYSPNTRRFRDDHPHQARQPSDLETYAAAEKLVAQVTQSILSTAGALGYSDADIMDVFEPSKVVGGRSLLKLSYSPRWLHTSSIADEWPSLYRLCTEFDDNDGLNRFQLVFAFASFTFGKPKVEPLMRLLLALCLNDRVRSERPQWLLTSPAPSFRLIDGVQPQRDAVTAQIREHVRPPSSTPARDLASLPGETVVAHSRRRDQEFKDQSSLSVQLLASHVLAQWPLPATGLIFDGLPTGHNAPSLWIDMEAQPLLDFLQRYLHSCSENAKFAAHVRRIESALRSPMAQDHFAQPLALLSVSSSATTSLMEYPASLFKLLPCSDPPAADDVQMTPEHQVEMPSGTPRVPDYQELRTLLARLEQRSEGNILHAYHSNLKESLACLETQDIPSSSTSLQPPHLDALRQDRDIHMQRVAACLGQLRSALEPHNSLERQLELSGRWPRVTPSGLLQLLCKAQYDTLPSSWRPPLMQYARAIVAYQQAQRVLEFSLCNRPEDVLKELENTVYDEASLADFQPDWMLIQIEANILSRPLQRSIAREMITPSPHQNALLQLNMGEGKSSVIVPFTVAALADGNVLARVIVLKALSTQMFDILVDRLGGLTNRRIFYLPFSRDVSMSPAAVEKIKSLFEQCARVRGVIIAQPEHILSFRLTSHDLLVSATSAEQIALANSVWTLQEWVTNHSRDVLDESDELLHARYQLLYTVGQPKPVDDHPHRWTTIQQVLAILDACAADLQERFPLAIAYRSRSDSAFPYIRLLTSEADDELRSSMVARILAGGLPNILLSTLSSIVRQQIAWFISHRSLDQETYTNVRYELSESSLWSGLLLLRGLLAPETGVLFYILKERRWRVDYGLDPTRTLMAVPYRAKDVPSMKAEFGHPDVAITLTYLSYYYGDLTAAQVMQCFSHLLALDDPQRVYGEWVEAGGSDIPAAIRDLPGVNLEDEEHIETMLVPTFSSNQVVINFYLAHVVFPREAREFPQKLGTSAWDLAESKPQVTTGFSGTKDNRFLLPSSISQRDIPEQRGTDAMVLSYMLQSENQYTVYTGVQSGVNYLQFIASQDNEVRVLLDVGAQMLDMKNRNLAAHWLSLCGQDIQAAIFFTDVDELTVLTRDGVVERFRSSPYSEQLDKCIVYLDDAHTRGTDLKLPSTYRAALTLGQKVTKDRLVQGAMRMRRLGYGQSLLVIAPPDIDRSIRSAGQLSNDALVTMSDVLQWAILETCADIMRHLPHWASQGIDYMSRRSADTQFKQTSNRTILQRDWLQPEARSLDQMYGLSSTSQVEGLWERTQNHTDIATRLVSLGVTELGSARLSEEQEREIVLEVEREQQVQRPPRVEAAPKPLRVHEDVREFVQSGHIPPASTEFISLFEPLRRSGDNWDERLLSTRDFVATVASSDANSLPALHEYMRPVAWVLSYGILSSSDNIRLVAISPYEANELLPDIRSSPSGVHLHVFSPRPFKNTSTISDLHFHTIPPTPGLAWSVPLLLRSQLCLWAGELWLENHESYKQLCTFLCLYMGLSAEDIEHLREGDHISGDGFVRHSGHAVIQDTEIDLLGFNGSPVGRLRKLFALRRKGVPYASTHMGRILDARELPVAEWEAP
ncbi:hypothetical protein PENSPDRAFT_693529 [Peniophora sp. CONT]|nr:hypothetical protein PENSPDRAFT_693529 [Peniophora sp. CONT]